MERSEQTTDDARLARPDEEPTGGTPATSSPGFRPPWAGREKPPPPVIAESAKSAELSSGFSGVPAVDGEAHAEPRTPERPEVAAIPTESANHTAPAELTVAEVDPAEPVSSADSVAWPVPVSSADTNAWPEPVRPVAEIVGAEPVDQGLSVDQDDELTAPETIEHVDPTVGPARPSDQGRSVDQPDEIDQAAPDDGLSPVAADVPTEADPEDDDVELGLGAVALALGAAPPVPPDLGEEPPPGEFAPADADWDVPAIALALEAEPPLPSDLLPESPEAPEPPESPEAPEEDSEEPPPPDSIGPDDDEAAGDEGESTVAVPAAAMAATAATEEPDTDHELLEPWALSGENQQDERDRHFPRRLVAPLAGRWSTMRRGERVNVVLYALTGLSILAMTLELLAGPDALPTDVTTTPAESASQTAPTVRSTTTVTFTLPQDSEPAPVVTRAPSRVTPPAPVDDEPVPAPEPGDEEPPPTSVPTPTVTTRPLPTTTPTLPPTTAPFPNTFPTPVPPVPPTFFGPTVPTTVPKIPSP